MDKRLVFKLDNHDIGFLTTPPFFNFFTYDPIAARIRKYFDPKTQYYLDGYAIELTTFSTQTLEQALAKEPQLENRIKIAKKFFDTHLNGKNRVIYLLSPQQDPIFITTFMSVYLMTIKHAERSVYWLLNQQHIERSQVVVYQRLILPLMNEKAAVAPKPQRVQSERPVRKDRQDAIKLGKFRLPSKQKLVNFGFSFFFTLASLVTSAFFTSAFKDSHEEIYSDKIVDFIRSNPNQKNNYIKLEYADNASFTSRLHVKNEYLKKPDRFIIDFGFANPTNFMSNLSLNTSKTTFYPSLLASQIGSSTTNVADLVNRHRLYDDRLYTFFPIIDENGVHNTVPVGSLAQAAVYVSETLADKLLDDFELAKDEDKLVRYRQLIDKEVDIRYEPTSSLKVVIKNVIDSSRGYGFDYQEIYADYFVANPYVLQPLSMPLATYFLVKPHRFVLKELANFLRDQRELVVFDIKPFEASNQNNIALAEMFVEMTKPFVFSEISYIFATMSLIFIAVAVFSYFSGISEGETRINQRALLAFVIVSFMLSVVVTPAMLASAIPAFKGQTLLTSATSIGYAVLLTIFAIAVNVMNQVMRRRQS